MARALGDTLASIRNGNAVTEAAKMLAEVAERVKETGRKGALKLTIVIEPDKTDDGAYTMEIIPIPVFPQRKFAKGIVFIGDHGDIVRDDPRQLSLLEDKEADRGNVADLSKIGRG